jgi:hypothetical protein
MSRFLLQRELGSQQVSAPRQPEWADGPWRPGCRWPKPGPSVYERRDQAHGPVTVVMTHTGRFVGLERDGDFEAAQPCCPDPSQCRREECWKPLGEYVRDRGAAP